MYNIDYDITGAIKITETFDPEITFIHKDQIHIVTIKDIKDLLVLKTFSCVKDHELPDRYLEITYRVYREDVVLTPWLDLDAEIVNFPEISPAFFYDVQIKFQRAGDNPNNFITLKSYEFNGLWDQPVEEPPVIRLSDTNHTIFYKPSQIYKVFKITDFELVTSEFTKTSALEVKFRFTQDSGRTFSQWEYLTKENISTIKINPIRFFMIEYMFIRKPSASSEPIYIWDLNLIGDFQNVSLDYYKTNLLGLKECCKPDADPLSNQGQMDNCELPDIFTQPLTQMQKDNLYAPYQINKAVSVLSKLSDDSMEIWGHPVTYFLTDPDVKGSDPIFHEHQLYKVVCNKDIKVLPVDNNFPSPQMAINSFDMSLFEQFEVHITKTMFKEAFGVDARPSKEDYMFFCNLNILYTVETAVPYRDFNNASIYYKVMLKKYNQKASVIGVSDTMTDRIKELTKNTTLNELFGAKTEEEFKRTANTDQYVNLAEDRVRYDLNCVIEKELIENSSLIINKNKYNLNVISDDTKPAITYRNVDNILKVSDNRAIMMWFKIEEYVANETFNLIDNYDVDLQIGYKVNLFNGNITLKLNNDQYLLPVPEITDGIWYCYLVNLNQRQRRIQQHLFKRNSTIELASGKIPSSKLKRLYNNDLDLEIQKFTHESSDPKIVIHPSNMSMTNIRIFNDIIPEDKFDIVLNQYIIKNGEYLILQDNCSRKFTMQYFNYNDVKPQQ